MSWQASKWAMGQHTGSGPAKAVLLVIAEASGVENCQLSHATIAQRAEISERCVWQQIRTLEAAGFIRRQARRKNGHRTSDLIILNMERQPAGGATSNRNDVRAESDVQPAPHAASTRTSAQNHPERRAEEPIELEPVRDEPVRICASRGGRPALVLVNSEPQRPDSGFEAWWALYPLKRGKPAARKAFEKVIRDRRATFDQLIEGATAYAAERAGQDPHKTKYPQGWLNDERWADERLPALVAEGGDLRRRAPQRWSAIGQAIDGLERFEDSQ
jgi:DNA-binding Lrp family transcriptional regulator